MAGWERGHSCARHRAGLEGSLCGAARGPPPAPAPSRLSGGDELRRLRLQLLPLLSLGEGPGQGCAIVLPGSCGAPGLRSRPLGGHIPSWLCGVKAPGAARRGDSQGRRFGPATAQACAPGGAMVGTRCHTRATPAGSSVWPPAPSPDLWGGTREHCARGWERGPLGFFGRAAMPQGQGISPHPGSPEEPLSQSPPSSHGSSSFLGGSSSPPAIP